MHNNGSSSIGGGKVPPPPPPRDLTGKKLISEGSSPSALPAASSPLRPPSLMTAAGSTASASTGITPDTSLSSRTAEAAPSKVAKPTLDSVSLNAMKAMRSLLSTIPKGATTLSSKQVQEVRTKATAAITEAKKTFTQQKTELLQLVASEFGKETEKLSNYQTHLNAMEQDLLGLSNALDSLQEPETNVNYDLGEAKNHISSFTKNLDKLLTLVEGEEHALRSTGSIVGEKILKVVATIAAVISAASFATLLAFCVAAVVMGVTTAPVSLPLLAITGVVSAAVAIGSAVGAAALGSDYADLRDSLTRLQEALEDTADLKAPPPLPPRIPSGLASAPSTEENQLAELADLTAKLEAELASS